MDALWLWLLAIVVVVVMLGGLVLWRVWPRDESARTLVRRIGRLSWRDKLGLAWALLSDRRVPLWLRAIIPALVVYLALPFDIIPDFIPVLGYLDDVAVVLVAGGVLLRFTPRDVLEEHLSRREVAREHPASSAS